MIYPYRRYEIDPTPTMPSGEAYRPLIPIRVFGPKRSIQMFGLLDAGADNVFLSASLAEILGIDLSSNTDLAHGAGGHEIDVRSGSIKIEISQNGESHQWSLVAGFLDSADEPAVAFLGHVGFLENFNANFNGGERTIDLTPNGRFHGVM